LQQAAVGHWQCKKAGERLNKKRILVQREIVLLRTPPPPTALKEESKQVTFDTLQLIRSTHFVRSGQVLQFTNFKGLSPS